MDQQVLKVATAARGQTVDPKPETGGGVVEAGRGQPARAWRQVLPQDLRDRAGGTPGLGFGVGGYRGTSLIRNRTPPQDPHRALGMVLL